MAPRIKLIVIFNLLWSEFIETNAMFRSASTDLGHALVVCDLTQIPAEGSGCRWYLDQVTDNQCVITICRSRPKRRIRFEELDPK